MVRIGVNSVYVVDRQACKNLAAYSQEPNLSPPSHNLRGSLRVGLAFFPSLLLTTSTHGPCHSGGI